MSITKSPICPDCGRNLTTTNLGGIPTFYCKKCDQLFPSQKQYRSMTPKKKRGM